MHLRFSCSPALEGDQVPNPRRKGLPALPLHARLPVIPSAVTALAILVQALVTWLAGRGKARLATRQVAAQGLAIYRGGSSPTLAAPRTAKGG
jgi:hypothetical protein